MHELGDHVSEDLENGGIARCLFLLFDVPKQNFLANVNQLKHLPAGALVRVILPRQATVDRLDVLLASRFID